MKQQYKVVKPFELQGFRPVAVGELISMHPDDAIAYDLLDSLEIVKPEKSKSK
jgi:hypothetical protein